MSQQSFSFMCQTFLELQSYKVATPESDLYSKHWENTPQEITKTAITFEYNVVQTRNLY